MLQWNCLKIWKEKKNQFRNSDSVKIYVQVQKKYLCLFYDCIHLPISYLFAFKQ